MLDLTEKSVVCNTFSVVYIVCCVTLGVLGKECSFTPGILPGGICCITLGVLGVVGLAILFLVFVVGFVTDNIVEEPVRVSFLVRIVAICFLNLDISPVG